MSEPNAKGERIERVREYNPGEHRDELRRVLARITGRKVTGRVEVDLSQGMPGTVRTRETVKTPE